MVEGVRLLNIDKEARKYISEYRKNHNDISFLEIGAHPTDIKIAVFAKNLGFKYSNMDIDHKTNVPERIHVVGDICSCPGISDESYDIVYSHNVFEHLKTPWTAAEECIRINKKGGMNIHIMPFSYEYHENPSDYFRFTHEGVKILFQNSGKMEEIISGYQGVTKPKRINKRSWHENWLVLYIGRKK